MEQTGAERREAGAPQKKGAGGSGMGNLGRALVFLLLICVVVLVLTDVLKKKYGKNNWFVQQSTKGYYDEQPQSIDVLCLGSSGLLSGVSPLEMYHQYGFTAYNRASKGQKPFLSLALLRETLEKHDLKAVVIDVLSLTSIVGDQAQEHAEAQFREAVDYMPWSKYRIQAIQEAQKNGYDVSLLDFAFPLSAYHDRWEEIAEDDFTYRTWPAYRLKGQYADMATKSYTFEAGYMQDPEESDETFFFIEEYLPYWEQICAVCREKGIDLVLVKMPSRNWSAYCHQLTEDFAAESGVAFIDFCMSDVQLQMEFDPTTDFRDSGQHANVTGSRKISDYLGAYLSERCGLEDKRGKPEFAEWEADYEGYLRRLTDADLMRQTNMISFLEMVGDDPDYLVMLATALDTSATWTEDEQKAFARIGITAPFDKMVNAEYLAIVDGGSLVYEKVNDMLDSDVEVDYFTTYDGHDISMSSKVSRVYSSSDSITFDGSAVNTTNREFLFAVYDRAIGQLVRQGSFTAGNRKVNFTAENPFKSLLNDPVALLEKATEGDNITVIASGRRGNMYMPASVNLWLAGMGLMPLDKGNTTPYIAILDGSRVVLNEYGNGSDKSMTRETVLDGLPILVTSDAQNNDNGHVYYNIGGEEGQITGIGLSVIVYDKQAGKVIAQPTFNWSMNYTAKRSYSKVSEIRELISWAAADGYGVICCCSDLGEMDEQTEEKLALLRESGMAELDGRGYFVGILRPDGTESHVKSPDEVQMEELGENMAIQIRATEAKRMVLFNGVEYSTRNRLFVMVYDGEDPCVLRSVSAVSDDQ